MQPGNFELRGAGSRRSRPSYNRCRTAVRLPLWGRLRRGERAFGFNRGRVGDQADQTAGAAGKVVIGLGCCVITSHDVTRRSGVMGPAGLRLLGHDLFRKPGSTLGSSPRASFSGSCLVHLGMIFSENRVPLFGIMPITSPPPRAPHRSVRECADRCWRDRRCRCNRGRRFRHCWSESQPCSGRRRRP
jgi:hypothetical protein